MSPLQKQKKKILLIHTGGTVAMTYGPSKTPQASWDTPQALVPHPDFPDRLLDLVPELTQLAEVETLTLFLKDSSEVTPSDWLKLAQCLQEKRETYDGFVVIHGTDTMAYTATALSFLLADFQKPIVFTGSQRPLIHPRTDARRNLITSVDLATQGLFPEVCIYFDQVLLRANRSTKLNTQEYHAFGSPNFPALYEDRLHPLIRSELTLKKDVHENSPFLLSKKKNPSFEGRIQVVQFFPGCTLSLWAQAQALVILGFGCGNIPKDPLKHLILGAIDLGIPVILGTQVGTGGVFPEFYEVGRWALEQGALPAGTLTFEALMVKVMLLTGAGLRGHRFQEAFQKNWAGE